MLFLERAPAFLFFGLSMLMYNIADAADGIVARKERLSSCAGEVIDHTVDAFVGVLTGTTFALLGCPTRIVLGVTLCFQVLFYMCHVQHRIEGGRLAQAIFGFGPDCEELLLALFGIVFGLVPSMQRYHPQVIYYLICTMAPLGVCTMSLRVFTAWYKHRTFKGSGKIMAMFLLYALSEAYLVVTMKLTYDESLLEYSSFITMMPLHFHQLLYGRLISLPGASHKQYANTFRPLHELQAL